MDFGQVGTIYCVGRNYVAHAKELDNEVPSEPLIFLKSKTALRGLNPGLLAFPKDTFHYEAEVILHVARDHEMGEPVSQDSYRHVSLGIDLTRRSVQSVLKSKGEPWTLSKSFVGSAIIGKRYTCEELGPIDSLIFEFWLNGKRKQIGDCQKMIFGFDVIGNYINTFSPLKRGDLIFTGTPEGVGEIRQGDTFQLKFPRAGFLEEGIL